MTLKVLAIDDSRTMRDLLQVSLTESGFDITLAEDGIDGLDKLETAEPDVVITDINMPRLDGFGVIEAVRARADHRATPILVLTTESSPEMKSRARTAGATGWIVKPFDDVALASAIHRVTA
ncbi:response regulator [Psychromarinibacter sp. C21-152]|uniref:Response regulator n=1 Tax=Psychromarinibacter sediminicola TaxID=3033385 RepID=A0AAE3T7T9_9RHOB|nr:response regulator [Psychromarinibacter sediminicola]MDF0600068.1 response regulator [Psychromarinibacter sediminicola]